MAKIWIDGVEHEIDAAKNLLQGCLEAGLDLPYFCWHPAMGSVGACRQCAVKQFRDEADTKGRIVMACMTPAAAGTRISLADEEAREFRKGIAELLMVNHPHDCPVCDEGGECHLQDMTVMTGHKMRNYRFTKKTYINQDLGPLVNHEMNRCIQCYRCVHFYKDHAGGKDLQAFAAHDHLYFGRHEDGVLESEFAGNLVEVCPTGVFTDKTLKGHYARKWDLQTAPSVCVHCSVGCNTIPGERYGTLRRIRNRYHGEVNGYFLCDRGRFGYEFVNDAARVRKPLVKPSSGTQLVPAAKDEALSRAARGLSQGRAIGIGSPRASMESNMALREVVGPERFFAGVSAHDASLVAEVLRVLTRGPARTPSLRQIEECDAVFVLGEDVTNTAPLAALAIRQAIKRAPAAKATKLGIPAWHADAVKTVVQGEHGPLYVATSSTTRLDGVATRTFRGATDDVVRLGFAVAHALDAATPAPADMDAATTGLANEIAAALRGAARPVIVSGTGSGSGAVIQAAASCAWAAAAARDGNPAEIFLVVPECNSLGLALFEAPALDAAVASLAQGKADTVIVLENDLTRRAPAADVDKLLSAPHVIVLDHLETPTTAKAEVVFPAGTFAEADGTLINNEGRAQRYFQVFMPETEILESWRWLRQIAQASGNTALDAWSSLTEATAAVAIALPSCKNIAQAVPEAELALHGARIPRGTHRTSGRTALRTHISVHEPKPPVDADSARSFSMEGYDGDVPPALTGNFWAPGWNSIQSLNRFQEELAGPLRGGDSGARLLEPTPGGRVAVTPAPPAFRRRENESWIVPMHHIFGSEELSARAPAIATLTTAAALTLGTDDAAALGVTAGDELEMRIDKTIARLSVQIDAGMPRGVAGFTTGFPGTPAVALPAWGRISK